MSDSPENIDINDVNDIAEVKDYFRELQQRNEHLKSLIADDRQRLQAIEFKHRESVDQIAILQSQKKAMQQELETKKKQNRNNANNIGNNNDGNDTRYERESVEDFDSESEDSEQQRDKTPKTKDEHISQLKEEIEELQLALAEERMLGMQLDFSNRQSAQRADALQYQLAEEKLKNMHLQTSHQQLQLNMDSNSSGFVHLRDANNNGKEILNNNVNDDNYDENNRSNNNQNNNRNTNQNHRNRNDNNENGEDNDSTSDLSREFDLKIEEEVEAPTDDKKEAQELRHKLLEEQFKTEELKHRHRKSELQLMQYKEALIELRNKYNIDENLDPSRMDYLDPVTANAMENRKDNNENSNDNNNNSNNDNNDNNNDESERGLSEEQREEYEGQIEQLRHELEIAKKKSQSLDKERRDSLNIMSKNFFAKQLQAARDTHSLEENMQFEINSLKDQIYEITKSKIKLLQSTNETIDQLRSHIVELSNRLRKYEDWGSGSTTPGGPDEIPIDSVNVTDL